MAKRFSDTDKWKKPFLRGLKASYKLLWIYILDECDHAGIWQVDFDVAQIKIGEKLNQAVALDLFKDQILEIKNGAKWLIKDFIPFQYVELNPANKFHNSIINILKQNGIDYEELKNMGYTSPLEGAIYMVKDKVLDKVKEYKGVQGENKSVQPVYRKFKHLTLTEDDFFKLSADGWSVGQIDDILDQIENFKQNTKYTSLLTTARVWLKRHHPADKKNSIEKKITALQTVQNEYNSESTSTPR